MADSVGGILAFVAVSVWRPGGWVLLASAAACFASFGLWGIADRELRERAATPSPGARLLRVLRAGVALTGALAGIALLLAGLALALGTWIS